MATADRPTPVVLLGGAENAVACARRFVADGVPVVVANHDGAPALRSRGVTGAPLGSGISSDTFRRWLGGEGKRWEGAVLLPLSDVALVALVEDYDNLRVSFRPTTLDPDVARAMLDKQTTLDLAEDAGVPTPRQWNVDGAVSPSLLAELTYPLILKPRHGFELIRLAGTKHMRVHSEAELLEQLPVVEQLPTGFVINEFIPGGDDELSSYYALRGPEGDTLLEFTKRVDRRCPPNKGGATYHELIDLPATAAAGRKFFDHIGLVGLGNVEFKHDTRSGELKLIECNHRLTAATALMQDNGIDVAGALYEQAMGRDPRCGPVAHQTGTLWYPVRDLISFRISGEGVRAWFGRPWRSGLPYWRMTDPRPSLYLWRTSGTAWLKKRLVGRAA